MIDEHTRLHAFLRDLHDRDQQDEPPVSKRFKFVASLVLVLALYGVIAAIASI